MKRILENRAFDRTLLATFFTYRNYESDLERLWPDKEKRIFSNQKPAAVAFPADTTGFRLLRVRPHRVGRCFVFCVTGPGLIDSNKSTRKINRIVFETFKTCPRND